jgi:hypothetical protein
VNRARRFVSFLAECGVVTPSTQDAPRPHDGRVLAFQTWLRRHRGITAATAQSVADCPQVCAGNLCR